jgi:hypothetical protein
MIERLTKRLTLEELRLTLGDAEEKRPAAAEEAQRVADKLRRVQEENQAAANASYAAGLEFSDLQRRIAILESHLLKEGDPATVAAQEAALREREKMVEGMSGPEYQDRKMRQLQGGGGAHVVETLEQEEALKRAAAEQGVDLLSTMTNKERG